MTQINNKGQINGGQVNDGGISRKNSNLTTRGKVWSFDRNVTLPHTQQGFTEGMTFASLHIRSPPPDKCPRFSDKPGQIAPSPFFISMPFIHELLITDID